ncbi:DUF1127 domain-containing protein [Rhodobacteraceae bacterium NNCM2]|nr:DUF1127 domain-containing protein [Coraliihabitans acroporae]
MSDRCCETPAAIVPADNLAQLLRDFWRWFAARLRSVKLFSAAGHSKDHLDRLDDHILKDIGLTRHDADRFGKGRIDPLDVEIRRRRF